MAEKASRKSKMDSRIPEEAREHFRTAREEMRKSIEALLPEGFVDHRRGARREMMMAWRSMLDAAIQRMDEKA
jgi:predicted nuclease with RNAse H fold